MLAPADSYLCFQCGSISSRLMEDQQQRPEAEGVMSFDPKVYEECTTQVWGSSRLQQDPQNRRLLLGLGLLNAALLLAAVVIGIFCAKADGTNQLITDSGVTPLIIELNFLRNQSAIIQERLGAEVAMVAEEKLLIELSLQMKQLNIRGDALQKQIEEIQNKKTNLQAQQRNLEESCNRCQLGWTYQKSTCYYFSVSSNNQPKNWPDSRADCVGRGGSLLVIDNLAEQQLISSNMPKYIPGVSWRDRGSWIGLTDQETEGTWVWVNNVTEAETIYWRSGEPVKDGPQSGNCAALFYFADTTKTWYTADCQQQLLHWICEMQPRQA